MTEECRFFLQTFSTVCLSYWTLLLEARDNVLIDSSLSPYYHAGWKVGPV